MISNEQVALYKEQGFIVVPDMLSPDELTNLSEMPDMKQQLVSLRTATVAELKRTGAGIADNLPAVANP